MQGYESKARLHREAVRKLNQGEDVISVIREYEKKMPASVKVKKAVMRAGSVLPDRLRVRAKKTVSALLMRGRK